MDTTARSLVIAGSVVAVSLGMLALMFVSPLLAAAVSSLGILALVLGSESAHRALPDGTEERPRLGGIGSTTSVAMPSTGDER